MEWQKKYRWIRTWPDDLGRDGKPVEDYAAYDGEHYVGRIRLDCESLKKGQWQWSGSWIKTGASGPIMPHHGFKPTAVEAARAVEDYWDAMLLKAKGGKPVPNLIDVYKGYCISVFSPAEHFAVITDPSGSIMDFGDRRPRATAQENADLCMERARQLIDELTVEVSE